MKHNDAYRFGDHPAVHGDWILGLGEGSPCTKGVGWERRTVGNPMAATGSPDKKSTKKQSVSQSINFSIRHTHTYIHTGKTWTFKEN